MQISHLVNFFLPLFSPRPVGDQLWSLTCLGSVSVTLLLELPLPRRNPETLWWKDSSQELVCTNAVENRLLMRVEIAEKAGIENFVPETQTTAS